MRTGVSHVAVSALFLSALTSTAVGAQEARAKCRNVDEGARLGTALEYRFDFVAYLPGMTGNGADFGVSPAGVDGLVCNIKDPSVTPPGADGVYTLDYGAGVGPDQTVKLGSCHPISRVVNLRIEKATAWNACVWYRIRE